MRAGPLSGKSSDRVHCSLNINTETGRLSARRPNLQNQPALEKDRYGIRKSFRCSEENTLIVADYGQLELRLLAHMCDCKSMLKAFELGGDFHSRTALGMFPHIQKAIDAKECFLEDTDRGPNSTAPLLKDKFSSERRKAKARRARPPAQQCTRRPGRRCLSMQRSVRSSLGLPIMASLPVRPADLPCRPRLPACLPACLPAWLPAHIRRFPPPHAVRLRGSGGGPL